MEILSLWLQNSGPAETTSYYIAGYVIFFVVMGVYMVSFFVRSRNLKQEFDLLQELENEG